jgi:hypothetical protein
VEVAVVPPSEEKKLLVGNVRLQLTPFLTDEGHFLELLKQSRDSQAYRRVSGVQSLFEKPHESHFSQ